ncbi:hypothetical protein ABZP36_028615 [Zizania latifolia]
MLKFAEIARELSNEMLEWVQGNKEKVKSIYDQLYGKKEDDEERTRGVSPSGAVSVVRAGSIDFSVEGVDVISAVTSTSRCGSAAESRRVPCGDPLCKKYSAGSQCGGSGAAQVCNISGGVDALSLLKGNVSLSTSTSQQVFSGDMVYACSPACGKASAGGSAVIGLSRDSDLANSSQRFAYLIDSEFRSFLWLGDDVPLTRGITTKLIAVDTPDMDPSLYYVNVTGIKVGDGSVKEKAAAGIMITTIPFTFLNRVLFDHLKKNLPAEAKLETDLPVKLGQLCYANDTKLPAIKLVLAGDDAAMKLDPEFYSYKKSNGMVCLTILPSPLIGGASIIGSMLQAVRRMTYDLGDETLTFEASLAPSPSQSQSQSTSPSSSASPVSSSADKVAALTTVFLSSTWAWASPLLLALAMPS